MSEFEKKVVEDLRRNARKSGAWSPGKEDMQTADELKAIIDEYLEGGERDVPPTEN